MNHKSNEGTTSLTQNPALQQPLKRFGVGVAAVALTCFGLASATLAQTSVVCDPAGDAQTGNGKGGPEIPAWLDIVQTEITDAGSDIHFTQTLNAAIPVAPAWDHVDDGGQLWWGWRFLDDLTQVTFIKDGCIKATGNIIPAGYFLDLIWDVPSSSLRARLLDDTTCAQNDVPFVFSNERTQVTLSLSRSLLTNGAVLPDPNAFQYFAQTTAWKPDKTGNSGLVHLDNAPDETDHGALVVVPWSASENATYFCR